MQELRKNKDYRNNEKEKDKILKASYLNDPIKSEHIRQKNRELKARNLSDPEKKIKTQERNRELKARNLNDPLKKEKVLENNRKAQAKILKDPIKGPIKRESNRKLKFFIRNDPNTAISKYEQAVKEGPSNICVCCGGLFFLRSVIKFKASDYKDKALLDKIFSIKIKSKEHNCYWLCITCNKYAKYNKKVPRLALSNGLQFNNIDQCLLELNELEERLCSPRIPFLKIRPLGWDKQKGAH